ncbi:carboxylesterase [Rhexocercosporidium sp. MPI-PUGE-AT-0058]|nr:carboxylesterase [Rhexocercosporidium sp. MPI-PUGE-AT-0058]
MLWESTFLTFCLAAIAPVYAVDTLVDLGYAKYVGAIHENGVSKWLGMRYAAPPLGDLRFAAPQNPLNVSRIQNATQNGPICFPQKPTDWTVTGGSTRYTTSEDCLYVSVFAPIRAYIDSYLPVVFFIQGGGFGSLSSANWDPSEIVREENVVVVQFNYRVGPYGFLQSEEVRAGGSLNNGIKDMIKALDWVREHIVKFGGNPYQVVLNGVSAGGSAVGLLMAANLGNIPFVGGISESGGWVTMRTMDHGQEQYDCLIKEKKCANTTDTLACLRTLPARELMTSNCWFNPGIDGELYKDSMVNLFKQGTYTKVPTIWGSCANEGTKYSVPESTDTVQDANKYLTGNDPTLSNSSLAILDNIYINKNETVFPNAGRKWRQTANAIADIGNNCIVKNIQDYISRDGIDTYNYKYAVLDPADEAAGYGAWHTVETYAFWGPNRTDGGPPASYKTTNAPIIPVVRKYWGSFIRTLSPNTNRANGAAEWAPYTGDESRERLFIQTNNTKMEFMSAAQSLRCQIVRPMSENLGKPPKKGTVTEFDPVLASKYEGTNDSTTKPRRLRNARRQM